MNKYLISVGIVVASLATVSANEIAGTVSVDAGNVVYTTSVAGTAAGQAGTVTVTSGAMPVRAMVGGQAISVKAMPINAAYQMGGVMTTGDATVDAKIRVIEEERMTKIRAINVEYDAKVKAAMGNLKPKAYTTTSISGQAAIAPTEAPTKGPQGNSMRINSSADAQVQAGDAMTMEAKAGANGEIGFPTGIRGFFFKLFH